VTLIERFRPSLVLRTRDHVAWVLLQQVAVKSLVLIKFLLAARILGPQQFGVLGVAFTALAIVESLSDTGLAQALVQRREASTPRELGGVWTLQMFRGLLAGLAMFVCAPWIAAGFGIPESGHLVALAAVVPLVRNAVNPGFLLLQRSRDFRSIALTESSVLLLDAALGLSLLAAGMGPVAILIGGVMGDALRALVSWTWFRCPIEPHARWREISGLGRFGFWIWGTSALAVLINQFDKLVVARWLGPTQFGLYQTSSRLAQLGIADLASAAGNYLFPTLARLHHQDPAAGRRYFYKSLALVGAATGTLALGIGVFAPFLLSTALGSQWLPAAPVLRALCVAMWIGSLIAVCVAYLRARGWPNTIVVAVVIQFAVLLLISYPAATHGGAVGMAAATAVAGFASLVYMLYKARSHG